MPSPRAVAKEGMVHKQSGGWPETEARKTRKPLLCSWDPAYPSREVGPQCLLTERGALCVNSQNPQLGLCHEGCRMGSWLLEL